MIVKLPKLLPYQVELHSYCTDESTKFITFLKSRQSGGSFFNKVMLLEWAMTNRYVRIGYVTPTLKLSKLFFKEIINAVEPLCKEINKTDLIIEFTTGSTVQFFSAESGDSIRGFQFEYLIVDEAAYQKADFYDMILRATVLIKGRKVLMCSTPYMNSGFFHQHYYLGLDNINDIYKSVKINIYNNPFVDRDEIEMIKRTVPERVFNQEYLAEFIDGEGVVFRNYKNCINSHSYTGKYYAAIDWAKENDNTVLTIINDKKEVMEMFVINKLDYTVQVQLIAAKLNSWKPIETISEENNIGSVVNELLKKQYKGKLRQITLDHQFKKDIIEGLIVAFEQGDISIPDDENLLNELSWFTAEYNRTTGRVYYAAKSGLHDDRVISLAYAYWLVNNNRKIIIR